MELLKECHLGAVLAASTAASLDLMWVDWMVDCLAGCWGLMLVESKVVMMVQAKAVLLVLSKVARMAELLAVMLGVS